MKEHIAEKGEQEKETDRKPSLRYSSKGNCEQQQGHKADRNDIENRRLQKKEGNDEHRIEANLY
jgi:hypothetical protein